MDTSFILDCETLDTRPGSVITEIGVIAVHRPDFVILDEILLIPDLFYQIDSGRSIDRDTVAFHRKQGTLPASTRGLTPIACCVALQNFFKSHSPKRVWIQGTCFDRPLLEDFFASQCQPLPWHFGTSRDARTLWELAFPGTKHDKRPHSAIPDCKATLADIHSSLKALGKLDSF